MLVHIVLVIFNVFNPLMLSDLAIEQTSKALEQGEMHNLQPLWII